MPAHPSKPSTFPPLLYHLAHPRFLVRPQLLTHSDALTWARTSRRPALPLQRSCAKIEDVRSSAGTVMAKCSRSTTRSRDRGACGSRKRSAYHILPHHIQHEAIRLKHVRISSPDWMFDGHLPHGRSARLDGNISIYSGVKPPAEASRAVRC
jgi:hypothetical protein